MAGLRINFENKSLQILAHNLPPDKSCTDFTKAEVMSFLLMMKN